MPQGLQVWDSSGVLQLDVTNSITTFLGVYTVTYANPTVSITNPIFSTNKGFYVKNFTSFGTVNSYKNTVQEIEKQVGDTYSITFPQLSVGVSFVIYVGAF